jgi:hypothetical protein
VKSVKRANPNVDAWDPRVGRFVGGRELVIQEANGASLLATAVVGYTQTGIPASSAPGRYAVKLAPGESPDMRLTVQQAQGRPWHRVTPKVKGKAAVKAHKRARQRAREQQAHRDRQLAAALAEQQATRRDEAAA